MTLGEKIKRFRIKKHMSQQKLADILGINQTFISALELNTRKPSYDLLPRLAEALNVNASDLVDKSEREESFTNMLLERLISEGLIKDSNNISQSELDMILSAIKVDIKRIQKEKGSC
jgi:transcriptional regulator with XRE-family HTH domain